LELDSVEEELPVSAQNDELAAVIAAAVGSYMSEHTGSKIRVKTIRRIPQTSPGWNVAGKHEQLSKKL